MICDEYQCIFVHIPKTAGQSIEHFFLDLVGLSWDSRSPLLLRSNTDPNLGPEKLGHLTASEYVDFHYLSQETFNDYYKFSFVRNPWERLVSEYFFHRYNRRFSFKDFVLKGFPEKSMKDLYRHIMPQYDFLYNPSGELLVDFVGKFENLQADFNIICETLNINNSTLPHFNAYKPMRSIRSILKNFLLARSRKSRYTDYYDMVLQEVVGEMYEKDIEAFGYQFGE